MSYCSAINNMEPEERRMLHKNYHDKRYGFPIQDDDELFGRLIMEINQAGLSWETILKKEAGFRKAYHDFNIKKIAAYTEKDRERLLNDPGIIRNRLKINAAIENANTILALQRDFGSFKGWIDSLHPNTKDGWVKIFKKTFRFTGGEIVNEFLMSTGYLEG
ncbi:MAG: DNA-3-methyladenine glycosylase I, partial [Chitinophagaceae bacterium]